MKPTRTHAAAAGTMVALGALAAVAIGAGAGEPAKTVSTAKAQPIEVRTVTVHRTVHVVRRQKRRPQVAAPPVPAAAVPRTVQIAQAPAAAPATVAPVSSKPLKTATSGSGSGHHEDGDDHEGGDDHGGGHDD